MAFWSQPRYDLYLYRAGWDMSVMTGPEEGAATAGQGHLRSAQADRDRVIATLKAAFVQGWTKTSSTLGSVRRWPRGPTRNWRR